MNSLLWLQAQPGGTGGFGMLVPMVAIFVIFYFLLIRPQQKKQRETEEMLKKIVKGDTVITAGGLHGKVTGVSDDVLTLEIASIKGDSVRVKVTRNRVEHVDPANSSAKETGKEANKEARKNGAKKGGGS